MEMTKYDPILYKQYSNNRAIVVDGLNVVIKETGVKAVGPGCGLWGD